MKYKAKNISAKSLKRTIQELPKLFKTAPLEQQYNRIQLVLLKLKQLKASPTEWDNDESFPIDYHIVLLEKELKKCQEKFRIKELNDIWFLKNKNDINSKRNFILKQKNNFQEFNKKLIELKNIQSIPSTDLLKSRAFLSDIAEQSLEIFPVIWQGSRSVECDEIRIDIHHLSLLLIDNMKILLDLYNKFPLNEIPSGSIKDDHSFNDFIQNFLDQVRQASIPSLIKKYNDLAEELKNSGVIFSIFMQKVNDIYNGLEFPKEMLELIAPILILKEIHCTLEGIDFEILEKFKSLYASAMYTINDFSACVDACLSQAGVLVRESIDQNSAEDLCINNIFRN